MTDRELLEAAARAAGIDSEEWVFSCGNCDSWAKWNPLTRPEDAFELQVNLKISVVYWKDGEGVTQCVNANNKCFEIVGPNRDTMIPTMRAITRAAAALSDQRQPPSAT